MKVPLKDCIFENVMERLVGYSQPYGNRKSSHKFFNEHDFYCSRVSESSVREYGITELELTPIVISWAMERPKWFDRPEHVQVCYRYESGSFPTRNGFITAFANSHEWHHRCLVAIPKIYNNLGDGI